MTDLSPQQQYNISQVAANMAIEELPLDEKTYDNLTQLAAGKKTADQIIDEIKKEYKNG